MIDPTPHICHSDPQKGGGFCMAGIIKTRQVCPGCGDKYPSSKGDSPIICSSCKTQPTKFLIQLYWQKRTITVSHDRDGQTVHHFQKASNLLGSIRTDLQAGIFDPEIYKKQSSTTFKAAWDRFLRDYEGRPGTYAKIEGIGRNHILPFFADYQMRDIRAYHLKDWWVEVKAKGLAPKYLNDLHQWLKSFLKQAMALDIIEKVPNFPDTLSAPEPDVDQWLTEEEQLSVLGYLPAYDLPIYDFMFLTGSRVNEATGLQRKDTDWSKHLTVIRHTIKRDGSLGIVKGKKRRVIQHSEDVVGCLKANPHVNQYQFINRWGRRYSDDYLRDRFREACEAAEVTPIKLKNATRHSFGMGLLKKGYDIWQVSKIMGHSDIKMTEHYVKMVGDSGRSPYGRSSTNLEHTTSHKN